jgi:RimJ/RimL family protein N-acetyltransferase
MHHEPGSLPAAGLNVQGVRLSGRWAELRAPRQGDLECIYRWRSDAESLYLWSALRKIPSYEEFLEEFSQLVRTTNYFVIESKALNCPIGFVYGYNASPVDGFAFIAQFTEPRFRRKRVAVEATLLFIRYMFTYFNLRKLYADVYEFNELAYRSLQNGGFQEQSVTPDHVWYGGHYWGLRRLAMYRADWEKLISRMARLLNDDSSIGPIGDADRGTIDIDGLARELQRVRQRR